MKELREGVCFQPIRAFLRRSCLVERTPRDAALAKTCVAIGAMTQESFPEEQRLSECNGWHTVGLQLEDEIRCCEQAARKDTKQSFKGSGTVSFLGACFS